jgi:hypothetical protein
LTLGLWSIDWERTRYPFGFGPWMIAGLLPLFVGLALILIYVLTQEPRDKEK